ncbi:hypothetical protein [Nonomuraea jabiensis]|uniref:hypothetical protein n=1 Tax=Nonomuraea jabiensis TaxID=882448 RepID=UPI0036827704
MVKLDHDSLAAYRGGLPGLPATSPATTGRAPDTSSTEARRYGEHIQQVENAFLGEPARKIPEAAAGRRIRTVYGGIALRIPGDKAAEVLTLPGAVAVQEDRPQPLLTDSSPAFPGAGTIHDQLGGNDSAGKGILAFAVHPKAVWRQSGRISYTTILDAAGPGGQRR